MSARNILIASQGPPDIEIFTLDLDPHAPLPAHLTDLHMISESSRELGAHYLGTPWEANITQLLGDSASFDFGPWARSVDLVYVDGSHSYPYVVSDTRNAMAMIRPGGVIVWDDYGSVRSEYGVTRYLEGLRDAGYPMFRLGGSERRAALRGRAVMRVSQEVLDRFAREQPG